MHKPEPDQYISFPDIRQARQDAYTYSIPKHVYQTWCGHRNNAYRRGIEFRFTLLRWHLWWMFELTQRGPDAKRGRRKGEFMMCRIGDAGAYETGNVYCGTPADNMNEPACRKTRSEIMIARHKATPCYLIGQRGDAHPKSKAVITPSGRFGSIALAAEAAGITRAGGLHRVRRGLWEYEAAREARRH